MPPPLPETLVRVNDVHRLFPNVYAVKGISFDIHRGQVVGFIGANGAGKTTTMRMMATLDVPSEGQIMIGNEDVVQRPDRVRRLVGWMPDNYGTYTHMTVLEYLDFFARAYGLKGKERANRVQEVMDFADLTPLADRMMNALSKGMGQRLCFGRMLLPDPEFLILDEPAAGLDPKARMEFKNLVRLLSQRGKTLFISSHILSELGEMCDTLLFIDAGKIVYHGGAESLRRGGAANGEMVAERTVVDITVAGDPSALVEWASMNPGWSVIEQRRDGARLAMVGDDAQALAGGLRKMVMDGLAVTDFHREERRLEDAFVDMIKQQAARSAHS
ncbi:MAG: transporter ATP-binding protein [Verrucomicrobiaceae bacterium]|nr:transporter ATP-binding protein [Verrucomicrobiaceae bacterium]